MELMNSLAGREITRLQSVSKFSRDRKQGIYGGPDGYHPTKEAKMSVLKDFLQIAKYLLPHDEPLKAGIMWHSDLHSGNIFVDEEQNANITGVIDWQAVPIYPMFLHADHPRLIDYEGEKLEPFQYPDVPTHLKDLGPTDQEAAKALFLGQSLRASYEVEIQLTYPSLIHTFRHRDTLPGQILGMIGSISDDGEPHVQSLLTHLTEENVWKKLVGVKAQGNPRVPCPLKYSDHEIQKQLLEYTQWKRDIERKARVFEEIGAYPGWDGAVLPEQYDDMVGRLDRAKQRFLDQEAHTPEEREAWERAWPFRDGRSQFVSKGPTKQLDRK